jgi:hypothetical protein
MEFCKVGHQFHDAVKSENPTIGAAVCLSLDRREKKPQDHVKGGK